MMRSAKKRQLELCVGLTEASMCQELVELEMGEGGQREKTLEMLAMGTVWEEYGGLFVYIRNGGGSDTVLAPGAEAGGQEEGVL